jgi:hypothetical protein
METVADRTAWQVGSDLPGDDSAESGATLRVEASGEGDGGVGEMLLQEPLREGLQVFAGPGKDEGVGGLGPFKFEAGGLGGDPDLPDGCVWRQDKLAGSVLEDDVHDAIVVFELEGGFVGLLFGCDERLLQGFEREVGLAAEGGFVDHEASLAGSWECSAPRAFESLGAS